MAEEIQLLKAQSQRNRVDKYTCLSEDNISNVAEVTENLLSENLTS